MTFVTNAHLLPVRKVTVNDERSSEDLKVDTFHMKLQAVLYALQHDQWNKPLHPTTKTAQKKRYCLTTPSASTLNLTPNRSVWCRKRMKA